jgi:putative hydrolase of the HAD superfamily
MSEGIKAVLFDLGNVLIDFDYAISAKRISHFCNKGPEDIAKIFFDSRATVLFEEGKLSPRDFFTEIKGLLDLNLSYERFVPIWDEIFFLSAKNRMVYSLINNLRPDYKTALLSNIDILHYEYLKKNFPVFNVFTGIFLSYELGLIKPNKLIYEKTLQALGVEPENTFYTDDRPDLIKSAQELGIKAFVFQGFKQLKADLLSVGVSAH